ncbi:endoglucanase [Streptomyces sp. NPDC000594]|uniref:endoglucanase n=1 Tax=Streptomyces sp. NPDC000594 TaxID=3154261 RepID=UPI003322BC1F
MPRLTTGPRRTRRVVVATLLLAAGLAAAGTARADDPGEATGPSGQKLTVSATKDIDPAGQKVTITGTGYDPGQGVYLAICVLPEPGKAPSPCIGGADMTGKSGSSYWITNNPPTGAEKLVKPFTVKDGKGGFTLDLKLKAQDKNADCTQAACAVVTRADHTASADRSADVIVPITFGTGGGVPKPEVPPGTVRHDAVRTIKPPSGGALDIEVDPKAKRLYLSSSDGTDHHLTTYDTTNGERIGDPVALPEVATALALDAESKTLHLGLGTRIATYATDTGEITDNRTPLSEENIALIAADPGADRLYFATSNHQKSDHRVTVYSTTTWKQVGTHAALPIPAGGLAVDTKENRAYAVGIGWVTEPGTEKKYLSNQLHGIDGDSGRLVSTLELSRDPLNSRGVAVDPEKGIGYVANMAEGTVSIVDLEEQKVTGAIEVGGGPRELAFDPVTGTLYAGQTSAGTVAVVDTAKKEVVQNLETGEGPEALALDRTAHTLFTLSNGTGEVVQSQRLVSPSVTTAPKTVSVEAGKRAEFTAAGKGTPAPQVIWEVSSDNGDTWRAVAGVTGGKLSFAGTVEHDGNRYRAVLSNPVGSVRTASAGLTVTAPEDPEGPGDGGDPDPGDPDKPGDGGDGDTPGDGDGGDGDGGSDGGTGDGGTGDGSSGGSGGSVGGGTAGGSGDIGGGGSLASTGMSLMPFTIGAAVLTALGAAALFLRRRVRA